MLKPGFKDTIQSVIPFTLSEAVWLCIAGPEKGWHTESEGLKPLSPVSPGECLNAEQLSVLKKRWESLSFTFFFFLQKFNSESEKLSYWNKYFPTKKVVFQQVSIFWCKQIYCGKIPNKLYFGVLQKKNVARENYWNGIYKGTHMILYRLQIKWQGSIWDKDLREFNLSFLGQWKSLIQETQPEINKQTNSVPTTTSHAFISL